MSAPEKLVATGAGKRAAATTVDALILFVPYVLALTDATPEPARVASAAAVLVLMAFQAYLLARFGQTIGKKLWRHRVVSRRTGESAGFLVAAVARPLAAWAPNILCLSLRAFPVWILADAATMVWRTDGLSLHDLICGTRVVDSPTVV
ncbi:MAG: RDD family protein [Elusimicrobiota bacterium]